MMAYPQNWLSGTISTSAQGYGRALRHTKLLRRMEAIIAEFERATPTARQQVERASRITYEPMAHPADTRLTLKEAVAFHPLTIAQIAAQALIGGGQLSQIMGCYYVPMPRLKQRIAEVLGLAMEDIRWPAYRVAEVA